METYNKPKIITQSYSGTTLATLIGILAFIFPVCAYIGTLTNTPQKTKEIYGEGVQLALGLLPELGVYLLAGAILTAPFAIWAFLERKRNKKARKQIEEFGEHIYNVYGLRLSMWASESLLAYNEYRGEVNGVDTELKMVYVNGSSNGILRYVEHFTTPEKDYSKSTSSASIEAPTPQKANPVLPKEMFTRTS